MVREFRNRKLQTLSAESKKTAVTACRIDLQFIISNCGDSVPPIKLDVLYNYNRTADTINLVHCPYSVWTIELSKFRDTVAEIDISNCDITDVIIKLVLFSFLYENTYEQFGNVQHYGKELRKPQINPEILQKIRAS